MTFTLKKKRTYKGGFRTEIEAAREYDQISIKHFGLQVSGSFLSFRQTET